MKNTLAAIIVALGATSTSALADTQIKGFASVIAGITTDADTSLFGYNDKLSFKPESLFALQVSSDLGEGLSATAQIMSRGENDYSANFEWAYLSYEISDSSQINAGRLRIPFYRYSDFLDVGYAYNWNRPPSSVYNSDFTSFDGLSYVYSSALGDADSSLQLIAGSNDGIINGNPSKLDNLVGINWTITYDWLTARIGYFGADVTVDIQNEGLVALIAGLNSVGLVDDANSIAVVEDFGDFFAIGLSADYNDFLFDFELISSGTEDAVAADQDSSYVSVGYRFDQWIVLATVETREDGFDDSRFGQIPSVYAPLDSLVDGALEGQEVQQDSVSVGVRYNFHPSASLKFDYTSSEINDADAVNVFTVGVDLVF
jgi:predicted porin